MLARLAEEVRERGTYNAMQGMLTHPELDELMANSLVGPGDG